MEELLNFYINIQFSIKVDVHMTVAIPIHSILNGAVTGFGAVPNKST